MSESKNIIKGMITPFFELNTTLDRYIMLFYEKDGKNISKNIGGYYWAMVEKGGRSSTVKQEFFDKQKKKFRQMTLATFGRGESLVIMDDGTIKMTE